MSDLRTHDERAHVACAIWLHSGFIGASVCAVGLFQLFDGETKWYSALALALLGGVLAAASWRRSHTVLDQGEWEFFSASNHVPSKPDPWREPRSRSIQPKSIRRINDDHGHSTAD
jgi:hypothetical protein